jgi:hypothetical protein
LYATVSNMSNSKFQLHYLSFFNFKYYEETILGPKIKDINLLMNLSAASCRVS